MEIFNRKKDPRKLFDQGKSTPVKHMLNTGKDHETGEIILPRKLNIVKFTGKKDIVDLRYVYFLLFLIRFSGFRIGDKYASVLQIALKNMNVVNKLKISNNRLTHKGI